MKVMVVDDEQMNRELFFDLFDRQDQVTDVQCFSSGQSAVDAFGKYSPDVVILDVLMPGMDGFETCQKIREKLGPTGPKVIMITGMAGDEIEQRGLKSGVDRFYFKPLNIRTLIQEVLEVA